MQNIGIVNPINFFNNNSRSIEVHKYAREFRLTLESNTEVDTNGKKSEEKLNNIQNWK